VDVMRALERVRKVLRKAEEWDRCGYVLDAYRWYVEAAELMVEVLKGGGLTAELEGFLERECERCIGRARELRDLRRKPREEWVERVFTGEGVGLSLKRMISDAVSSVSIMSYLIFDVRLVRGESGFFRVDLLDTLIRKSDDGVNVRVITSPPSASRLGVEAARKQYEAVSRMAVAGVPVRLCDFVHSKFVLADACLLWKGSANLTGSGLSGRRDVVDVTCDPRVVGEYSKIFEARWSGRDEACSACAERSCRLGLR